MEHSINNEIILEKPIPVYCPIMKANLKVNSTLLDEIGEFTQFILFSIGKGFNINDINNITELGEYLIRDEVYHLEKWGLIERESTGYFLTDVGKSYFKILKFVDYINNLNVEVQINCFNGLVMEDEGIVLDEQQCLNTIQKLKVDIVKELCQNKNYGNSKEYFIEKFEYEIYNEYELTEEEIDSLDITLNYRKGSLYREFYINKISPVDKCLNQENNVLYDIVLKREIIALNLQVENTQLSEHRNVLSTLKNISDFDNKLLSKKASDILLLWEEEKELNKLIETVYLDTATKQLLLHFNYDNDNDEKLYKLNIPRLYEVEDIDWEELKKTLEVGDNYTIKTSEESSIYYFNKINSELLEKEMNDV